MTIATRPQGLSDVAAGRLDRTTVDANFRDLHPALTDHEAKVESDRCYFCFEAPCQEACPTSIDIPMFIRQIAADNRAGAARTIFDANILGGMCARVCPTETLCEEACVREAAEGKPVRIGLLQRHATDALIETGRSPYVRAAPTGKRAAVVGAGPAGLACAHALAVAGHRGDDFRGARQAGGPERIRHRRLQGGRRFRRAGRRLSSSRSGGSRRSTAWRSASTSSSRTCGATMTPCSSAWAPRRQQARPAGEGELENVVDAVDYIADLRQAEDKTTLPVGRRVVVIGGGMTAIDVAVQSKLLGARDVTIVYRRGEEHMKASRFEHELAQTNGVVIRTWARPVAIEGHAGVLSGVLFERTHDKGRARRRRRGVPDRGRHACSPPSASAGRRTRSTARRSR